MAIYGLIGYLSFIEPEYLNQYAYWPFAVLSIIAFSALLLIGPRVRFTSQLPQKSLLSWLFLLWLGLLGFIVVSNIIQLTITNFNPYVARMYISNETYWEAITPLIEPSNIYYWGYMSALVCWAVALSYVYYYKKGVPCAHRIGAPLVSRLFKHRKWPIWAKAFGESHVYVVTMAWFALVLLSTVVLLASGMLGLTKTPTYFTIPIISMSCFSILFLYFASSVFAKTIRKLNRFKLDLSLVTFILIVCILLFLFIASMAIKLIIAHNPDILKLVECDCTLNKLKLFTESRMENLGWSVWILTLPVIATYVVRISHGRNALEVIFGIIGFAVLLQTLFYFVNITWLFSLMDYMHQTAVQFYLGGGLALFLFIVFLKHKNSWIFNNGLIKAMPRKDAEGKDLYKVSEVSLYDGTKIRGLGTVARKWTVMCLGTLLIHTIGGWQVLQVEMTLFAVILVYLYLLALVGFWVEWIADRSSIRSTQK